MKFTYSDLQLMQRQAPIKNAVLTFDESTQDIQFLSITDNEALKEIRFTAPQPRLRYLDFGRCSIQKILFSHECGNLQAVYLERNQITAFAIQAPLPRLTLLDLSHNPNLSQLSVTSVPDSLRYLYLYGCNLNDVSMFAKHFTLPDFDFNIERNNSLQTPPPEIVSQGKGAVVNYFRQIAEQGREKLFEAKVLFVGEPGAGKTTLMKLMLNPTYKLTENQESTVGVTVEFGWSFPVEKSINFLANLWDFGGQDVQFMFHQFFLTTSALYLLLTDNRKQNTHFNYWFNIINLLGTDSKVLVVKNEHKGQKITNFEEYNYRKYFPNIDFSCFDVDLGNPTDGRINALTGIIKTILQQLKHIGNEIPAGWPKVRQEIISRKQENYLSWEDYSKICEKYNISVKEDQQYLLNYLHIAGLVLYFKDDVFLSDTIFINPNWVFDAIYSVLKQERIIANNGVFEKKIIDDGWTRYKPSEKAKLFRLLLKDKFDVCYPLDSDEKKFMAPLLLSEKRQIINWTSQERILYQLEYEFLPYGLLSRLIVRLNDLIDRDILWKNGVMFTDNGAYALVTFNEINKRFIEIELEGSKEARKRLLGNILLGIEKIHERSFPNIQYNEKVPCNCSICKKSAEPHLFNVKALLNWAEKGRTIAACEKSSEDVEIQGILDVIFNNEQIQKRMAESKKGSDTYNIETNYQINQSQENSDNSSQNIKIMTTKSDKLGNLKPWWKKVWVIVAAIVAFLSGIAGIFGKNLADLLGY